MCWFEIQVKRVYEDDVKAFSNWLYRHQSAKNNVAGLLGYRV